MVVFCVSFLFFCVVKSENWDAWFVVLFFFGCHRYSVMVVADECATEVVLCAVGEPFCERHRFVCSLGNPEP